MERRAARLARSLRGFIDNPMTLFLRGVILLYIGLSDVWLTIHEDLARGRLRVGHGLVLIGFFNVLDALPHFLDGLDAGARLLEGSRRPGQEDEERRP